MSRAAGYEELPGGVEGAPVRSAGGSSGGSGAVVRWLRLPVSEPADTIVTACPPPPLSAEPPYVPQPGATPAATQQPVLGVPVPQQSPTHQFSPTQQGFPEHLTGLPTAAEEWDGAAVLMSIWLGCSAASLLLSLLTANT